MVNFQSIRNSITQATEATSILTIQNVNINDSGNYTCSANGMERSLKQSMLVIVHGKVERMNSVFLLVKLTTDLKTPVILTAILNF